MKVFSTETSALLGEKAQNIRTLSELSLEIPETYIVQKNCFGELSWKTFLKKDMEYILRPSIEGEDGEKKSLAGYFRSIFPLTHEEVGDIFSKYTDFHTIFQTGTYELRSVIIQEYISSDRYGVYFTRNPLNILEKGWIEGASKNDGITSGRQNPEKQFSFFEKKELEKIGNILEKHFGCPQDIEFCIRKNQIIILQTRPITTGNITPYTLGQWGNITGIYKKLDFDELGEVSDFFSYEVLRGLFDCLYLGGTIYFRSEFFPSFLFRKIQTPDLHLRNFYLEYRKYLIGKYLFSIFRWISFQCLDKKILGLFFREYSYSFLLSEKSNLGVYFDYKTNFLTHLFLKLEKQKQKAFISLEQYKNKQKPSEQKEYREGAMKLADILFLYRGKILRTKNEDQSIYPGIIEGIITDRDHFDPKKEKQVLISETLNFPLPDMLKGLSGVIIKKGGKLSHNAILLREYRIPSRVNYPDFDTLKIGDSIHLE